MGRRVVARAGRMLALAAISCGVIGIGGCARSAATPVDLATLAPCRLPGIDREARCGTIDRAENPDDPNGRTLSIAYAVVPATATHRLDDAMFILAGGPGQSSIGIAGQVVPLFADLNARRDLVFVDQRGTGRSNALGCVSGNRRPLLADMLDQRAADARLDACLERHRSHADLAQYATWIAMRDLDAVRERLGYPRINVWGGSYGTRAALEYARQFPQHVRTLVLDGVAPAGMKLPVAFAFDTDAALDAVLAACRADRTCASAHPDLRSQVDRLFAQPGDAAHARVRDPFFDADTALDHDRLTVVSALRAPLYDSALAAVLPHAIDRAAHGDWVAMTGLSSALAEAFDPALFAEGMHFAVICAEDMPRIDAGDRKAVGKTRSGTLFIDRYARACGHVPVRPVPDAFYSRPSIDAPVLALSGGLDPATPPRHAQAVVDALPHARHLVAPGLGHLVSPHGCAPQLITRFVRDASADGLDPACLARIPPPTFFAPAVARAGPP